MTPETRAKIRRKVTPAGKVRWQLSIVGPDGAEHRHGAYGTRREAIAERDRLLGDGARGGYVAPSLLTVRGYLLDVWLPLREVADLAPTTRELDRMNVAKYIVPHLGDVRLQQLGAEQVAALYADLARSGGRKGRPLAAATVRNVHGTLTKSLGDAVRLGRLHRSPMADIDPPPRGAPKTGERTWSRDEARRFLTVADADRLAAVWRLAFALGCRPGELVGLRWSEIDLDAGTVRIVRQVQPDRAPGGGVRIREVTKTRRGRAVPLDARRSIDALRAHKAQQAAERLLLGAAYADGAWVVAEADGRVIHPATLAERFDRLVAAAGLRRIVQYGIRHTSATLALEAGERPEVVAARLGNSVKVLLSTYAHVSPAAERQAAERLAAVLDGD